MCIRDRDCQGNSRFVRRRPALQVFHDGEGAGHVHIDRDRKLRCFANAGRHPFGDGAADAGQGDAATPGRRPPPTMRQTPAAREKRLAALAHLLDSVSPLSTLARGYAILSDAEGRVLRAATDTTPGARVQARLASGSIDCTVDAVHAV